MNDKKSLKLLAAGCCAITFAQPLWAQKPMEEILITGGRDAIKELPGSAHLLDKSDLEVFDYSDINRVLPAVPGVYIRAEDGYGLRPNIGIRGASPERSQKITLMEDGILIAPAPYSAPAAYYFPNVARMQAVEVFKGPASIEYGPHTVGGAVNLVSRSIPEAFTGEADVTYGSHNFRKFRVFVGDKFVQSGYWVEALNYGSDGFKELDGGGDTGFVRNDFNARVQWRFGTEIDQTLDMKIGYADEESDETYLGLTDADFEQNPYRRYRASQLDRFVSEHTQLHLLHSADFGNGLVVRSTLYGNRFDRAWNKFDGFIDGPEVQDILRNPGNFLEGTPYLDILRGGVDSDGSEAQTIDVTNNDRQYGSQGVEVKVNYDFAAGAWQHAFEVGLRFHHDYVERHHWVRGYLMQSGQLVFDGVEDRAPKALNRAEADALAVFIADRASLGNWDITAGVRLEKIEGRLNDQLNDSDIESSSDVVMPGLGVFYQFTDTLGLLAGVNKGFSPNAPGLNEDVEPEESINYEYGFRYVNGELSLEAIGFFSDYENLIGRCRVSDAGCTADEEFNGGRVEIGGLEVAGQYVAALWAWEMPLLLSYTYTESAFQTGFQSEFSQWGAVNEGDELPYLPKHLLRFQAGLESGRWRANIGVKYVDEMREQPGQGDIENDLHTEAYATIDVAYAWLFSDDWEFQLTVDNLTDEQNIVSRRPFGARPQKPRSVMATVKFRY